ncbi:hypothetical protein RA086_11900 [Lactiplantibacillus sp. WILCCON 0030]|uniref:MORN repeat protein n=1 Tax=Lactiplantibacillus brownii TaxID=3069269 RepID=A0ABU1ABG7_9LACO|nr:hypothetical protein [Lactiplantibacillus brownii]MDQ7938312.1 hypothetical protein [Lactiplantibacillus brownii]
MKKRWLFEGLVVLTLIGLANFSLSTSKQQQAHYTLDHQRIIYDGGMLKNKFNGQGKLKLANQDYYVGHFKNGQFSGHGNFKSHKNWQYQGNFTAGVPDGKGVLTTANKKTYRGLFNKGELVHAD